LGARMSSLPSIELPLRHREEFLGTRSLYERIDSADPLWSGSAFSGCRPLSLG
jgi:hypothetical protein